MRSLWFEQNIKEAIDAPRIHHQIYPMHIQYEYGILQVFLYSDFEILQLMFCILANYRWFRSIRS